MGKAQDNDETRIRELLSELNHWEQTAGTTYSGNPRLKSTGESNARIADLKEKLDAQGARYHWNGTEYVLDSVGEPGEGGQGEDETAPD